MEPIIDHSVVASTTNVKDITSDRTNREILHRLKNNDPSFPSIIVRNPGDRGDDFRNDVYYPSSACDLLWLGYFIGKAKHLEQIELEDYAQEGQGTNFSRQSIASLSRGLNSNKSIRTIMFWNLNLSEGEFFPLLSPFLKNNQSLIEMKIYDCILSRECAHRLALILESRTSNSLMDFALENCGEIDDESFAAIFRALSMHSRLNALRLSDNMFGRNSYSELEMLLSGSFPSLHHLKLSNSTIDDEGIHEMAMALTENSTLTQLDLSGSRSITLQGYRSLSTLLEDPNCELEILNLGSCNVNDEAITEFAKALANNRSIECLYLEGNPAISATKGWAAFSWVVCDVSSIENTFLSNHILEDLRLETYVEDAPIHLVSCLKLNENMNKKKVEVNKILMLHDDFNMDLFFKWDLKMLPFIIGWFERASDIPRDFEANLEQRKLSAMYQFGRNFSCLYGM